MEILTGAYQDVDEVIAMTRNRQGQMKLRLLILEKKRS